MKDHKYRSALDIWIEPFLALVLVVGMIRAITFLVSFGYPPQPYFYDPDDTWMDWFNTADWARNRGAYDSWRTVYAPLTFVFLKIFGIHSCYGDGNPRLCDWLGTFYLHATYASIIILTAIIFTKANRRTAIPRSLALAVSLPLTSALERGNIIIVAFLCFILAFGPLIKSARVRWIMIGLAINFKIYILASVFPQLLRRRWRWFEGAIVSTVAIYLLSWGILGRGSPLEIYRNVVNFNEVLQPNQFLDVLYASTYAPLLQLLRNETFPITTLIGSKYVDIALFILPLMQRIVQVMIILGAIAAWLRPESVPMYRLTNLGMLFALITIESGGYSQVFIIFLMFLEPWRGVLLKSAIISTYLLCIQFDVAIERGAPLVRQTFFNNGQLIVNYDIMFGSFIRPLAFYLIPILVALETIAVVWKDIRAQGWKSRWRYRHDLPIMVGQGAAFPPR